MRLWADLVKTARKQHVWDVVRVASKFCLLYDDNRWEKIKEVDSTITKGNESRSSQTGNQLGSTGNDIVHGIFSQEEQQGMTVFTDEDDLMRILAEIHFVYAEVSIAALILFNCFFLLNFIVGLLPIYIHLFKVEMSVQHY